MSARCLWFALVFIVPLWQSASADDGLPPRTIVVYNSRSSESVALAKFYAQKRGIPRDHLVALQCSTEEEISRAQYDETIAEPLRAAMQKRGWWKVHEAEDGSRRIESSTVNFVALIKGIPLKVKPEPSPIPGDKPGAGPIMDRNEASVDSEIAALGFFEKQISGPLTNPYFQSYTALANYHDAPVLAVSRLDAPSAANVRRMITDAIDAEKTGLWGRAYVDGANNTSGGLAEGDVWMRAIVDELHKVGVPVVYENTPAIFPTGYPMSDCALYYGWYAGNIAGPFNDHDFKFVPGAVAMHIHSYSAATIRDVNAGWAGPLIARGAAATVGNVYEPYLQLTAHFDIINDRLLHGFTWAESVLMSSRGLSWMGIALGDPLYRPYLNWTQLDARNAKNDWRAYHELAVKNAAAPPDDFEKQARALAARTSNGFIFEDLGGRAYLAGKYDVAANYFLQARGDYSKRDDIIRGVLEECDADVKAGNPKRALDLVRMVLRILPDTPAAPLLRKIEGDLAPKPPTPRATPSR
ncbi:MAG: TIGR03790 family protein [Verrucomicrobiota bacterium]|nr:TIGR03790 family protein [Verrucomicrobiota bacterium]